jgi:hypothetical protein
MDQIINKAIERIVDFSASPFPQSPKILAEILAGVPDDDQAKPAPDHDPGIAGSNTAVYHFDVTRLTAPA